MDWEKGTERSARSEEKDFVVKTGGPGRSLQPPNRFPQLPQYLSGLLAMLILVL